MSLRSFITFLFLLIFTYSQDLFPRKVWLYWDQPIDKAPFIIHLFYQKFVHICAQQYWELTLLTKQNLHEQIDDYQNNIQKVINNAKYSYKQNTVDLIRFVVLEQHGGVYFDISQIPIQGLQWIQEINLQKYRYLLTNIQNAGKPDVLIPYIVGSQNVAEKRQQDGSLFNPDPAYEGWFIASVPHAPAIQQWLKWFIEFYTHTADQNSQRLIRDNIYMRNVDLVDYLSISKSIYYFLQIKQKQLDKKLTILGGEKRIYAFHFYKIWAFKAQFGPFAFYSYSQPHLVDWMFTHTLEEVKQNYIEIRFLVKLSRLDRPMLEKILEFQMQLGNKTNGENIPSQSRLANFIATNEPTQKQCSQLIFPLYGSAVWKLLQNNEYGQKLKLFGASRMDIQQWTQKCSKIFPPQTPFQYPATLFTQKPSLIETVICYFISSIISSQANIYEIKLWDSKRNTMILLSQRLWIFWKNNQFILKVWFSCIIVIPLVQALIVLIMKIVVRGILIINDSNNQTCNQKQFQKIRKKSTQGQQMQHVYDQSHIGYKSLPSNQLIKLLKQTIYIIFSCYIIGSFQFYDNFGDNHSDIRVFITTIFAIFIQRFVLKGLDNNTNFILSIKYRQLKYFFQNLIFYELGKQILNRMQIRHNSLLPDTVVICLIYPVLTRIGERVGFIKIKQDIKERQKNKVLGFILKTKKYNYIVLVVIVFLCTFTNLRYIVINEYYIFRYIPIIAKAYIFLVQLAVLYEIISCLVVSFLTISSINFPNQRPQVPSQLQTISYLLIVLQLSFMWFNFTQFHTRVQTLPLTNELAHKAILQHLIILYFTITYFVTKIKFTSNNDHIWINQIISQKLLVIILHSLMLICLSILTFGKLYILDNVVFVLIVFVITLIIAGTAVRFQEYQYNQSETQHFKHQTNIFINTNRQVINVSDNINTSSSSENLKQYQQSQKYTSLNQKSPQKNIHQDHFQQKTQLKSVSGIVYAKVHTHQFLQ